MTVPDPKKPQELHLLEVLRWVLTLVGREQTAQASQSTPRSKGRLLPEASLASKELDLDFSSRGGMDRMKLSRRSKQSLLVFGRTQLIEVGLYTVSRTSSGLRDALTGKAELLACQRCLALLFLLGVVLEYTSKAATSPNWLTVGS